MVFFPLHINFSKWGKYVTLNFPFSYHLLCPFLAKFFKQRSPNFVSNSLLLTWCNNPCSWLLILPLRRILLLSRLLILLLQVKTTPPNVCVNSGPSFRRNFSLTWPEQCLVLMTTSFMKCTPNFWLLFLTFHWLLLICVPKFSTQILFSQFKNIVWEHGFSYNQGMNSYSLHPFKAPNPLIFYLFPLCNFRIGCRQIPQMLLYYSDS